MRSVRCSYFKNLWSSEGQIYKTNNGQAKEKIDQGSRVANQCNVALNSIIENVDKVSIFEILQPYSDSDFITSYEIKFGTAENRLKFSLGGSSHMQLEDMLSADKKRKSISIK